MSIIGSIIGLAYFTVVLGSLIVGRLWSDGDQTLAVFGFIFWLVCLIVGGLWGGKKEWI